MLVVYTSCKSRKEAEAIGKKLVAGKLAACASVFPCRSIFSWEGRLCRESEFVLELKIKSGNYPAVEKRIIALHSYSLPQVFALEPRKASRAYSSWVEKG